MDVLRTSNCGSLPDAVERDTSDLLLEAAEARRLAFQSCSGNTARDLLAYAMKLEQYVGRWERRLRRWQYLCRREGKALSMTALLDENIREALNRIRERRLGTQLVEQRERFYLCRVCGQAIDQRSLVQIIHHQDDGHRRLTEAELTESTSEIRAD